MRAQWWLCVLLLGCGIRAANAQEINEREAIQKFLAATPLSGVGRAEAEVARAEWRSLSLPPNPVIAASIEDSAGTRDRFLLFQQAVPITGRLSLLKKAGENAVTSTQGLAARRLQLAVSDFRKTFLAFGAAQQRQAALRTNIDRLTELLRVLREREKAGEGSGFDVMRAERELVDAQAELKLAFVAVEQARSRLAGFAPDLAGPSVTTSIQTDHTLPSLDEALRQAFENRPDYRARRYELEKAALEQRAAGRLKIPEPMLTGGLKRTSLFGSTDNGFVAGLSFSLPLFSRGQAETARFRAEQARISGEQLLLQLQIEAEVRSAYAAAAASAELAESYQPSAASEFLHTAESAYEEGERGILELIDAHRLATQADLRRLELIRTAKEARIDLDLAVGTEVQP